MQTYELKLKSDVSKSFRCQKAANSLDIDVEKKSEHNLKVTADIKSPFNVGLIIGSSGSGKTTLAKHIYGENCFKNCLDQEKPIIEQLPENLSYEECASILSGIGLTSVPCWIRPVKTLSNGQKARAEAAIQMATNENVIMDEWTSVVDRTVAKVMSHCVQKYARKNKKQIVLLSCHYDIIEWIQPDWVIDCNKQTFEDRRLLRQTRDEKLEFTIREIDRSTWKYFSKYHYLSERLPGGKIYTFGLFEGENQIGFQCFANYTPTKKNTVPIFHSNRTVVHPDYAGLGLSIKLINETSKFMKQKYKYRIMAKFSSTPIYNLMSKQKEWELKEIKRICIMPHSGNMIRQHGFREKIKTYSFEYLE